MSTSNGYDVLQQLAGEDRAVLSPWRAHAYMRRKSTAAGKQSRTGRLLRKMESQGLLACIEGAPEHSIYQVTSPYAPKQINAYEAASEAFYAGALCYGTALEVHRLSEQRSGTLHVLLPRSPSGSVARRTVPSRPTSPTFRLTRSYGQPHHWTLEGKEGTLALSGNAFARETDDRQAIETFREFGAGAPILSGAEAEAALSSSVSAFYHVFSAKGGRHQWAFTSALSDVIARGSGEYQTEQKAQEAAELARESVGLAETEVGFDVSGLIPWARRRKTGAWSRCLRSCV